MRAKDLMRGFVSLIVGVVLATAPSWAKLKLEPPDPARGSIGIKIKVIPPAKMGSSHADVVYFVRVEEERDRFAAENVIPSNYSKGTHVYLLNAKPGKYVAVGCVFNLAAGGGDGVVAFPKPDIARTEVEVAPGKLVFAGDIESSSSTKTDNADPAQSHYLRLISPEGAKHGFLGRAMTGNFMYIGGFKSFEREDPAESSFWAEAGQQHFKNEPAWTSAILNRKSGAAAATVAVATAGPATVAATDPLTRLAGDWGLTMLTIGAGRFGGPRCGPTDKPGPSPVTVARAADGAVSLSVHCNDGSDYAFRLERDGASSGYLLSVRSKEGVSVERLPVEYATASGWLGKKEHPAVEAGATVTGMVAPIEGESWSGWSIIACPTKATDVDPEKLEAAYIRADLTRRK